LFRTENQAFALAMQIVLMHLFGDVPSPVLVGLIKDTLAPGCVGQCYGLCADAVR
jgi:hypothetical protein